jgi:23S rRNA (cytosine1962-C5)-methyltransferase
MLWIGLAALFVASFSAHAAERLAAVSYSKLKGRGEQSPLFFFRGLRAKPSAFYFVLPSRTSHQQSAYNTRYPMQTLIPDWVDYKLLDCGGGKKLERFGQFTLIRPEPQANWTPALEPNLWEAADAEFVKTGRGRQGQWKFRAPIPPRWAIERKGLKFLVQPAPSGHLGVFPDQACHWDWIAQVVGRAARPIKMLCLFGHTGLATLSAAARGAQVTHVEASRKAVALARENQKLSGLEDPPIRWIVDDALSFVHREARRGNRYEAMILDPPRFGHGPDGELWKLDDSLPELLTACAKLLAGSPVFVLLNVYTTMLTQARAEQEAYALERYLGKMLNNRDRAVRAGELALEDSARHRISASVFARAEF